MTVYSDNVAERKFRPRRDNGVMTDNFKDLQNFSVYISTFISPSQ